MKYDWTEIGIGILIGSLGVALSLGEYYQKKEAKEKKELIKNYQNKNDVPFYKSIEKNKNYYIEDFIQD